MKLSTNQEKLLKQISDGSLPNSCKRSDLHLLMGTGLIRRRPFSSTYVVTLLGEKRLASSSEQ